MNVGILEDIWTGFVGQVRRSPWSVLLLWSGLTVATLALAVGFGFAESTYTGLRSRLPGDLDRLHYLSATESFTKGGDGGLRPSTWKGFTTVAMDRLLHEGLISGYFHDVRGRPITIQSPGDSGTRTVMVNLIIFRGEVPLYAGTATGVLARAEGTGGVVANQALASRTGGPKLGDTVVVFPWDRRSVVAYTGPESSIDRGSTLLVPDTSDDRTGSGINEVGVYLAPGISPTALRSRLTALLLPEHPALELVMTSGQERHGGSLQEATAVASMASGAALVLALVAFINTGSFVSLWILNRTQGLSLRRTLGATPRLITLYIVSDLVLVTASAVLAGLGLIFISDRLWFQPFHIRALTTGSVAMACMFMAAGTAVMGLLLTRTVSRREPGAMLGRVF